MAIIYDETNIEWNFSYICTIYPYIAEPLAVLKAIEYTKYNVDDNNVSIFSNYLYTVTSIQNHYSSSNIAWKIYNSHTMAQQLGQILLIQGFQGTAVYPETNKQINPPN